MRPPPEAVPRSPRSPRSERPLRCVVFATTQNPNVLVAAQLFDGIAGACFGIMVPLIVSDVAGRSGHFNLSLGAVGFGIGIGATVSTPAAGWMAGAAQRGWKAVIEFSPEARQHTLELWPSPGPDFEIMKRVKNLFDPSNLLNVGRLYRRI